MAHFELGKKIKVEKELNIEEIKSFIKKRLSKPCSYKVVADSGNTLTIKGAVKENLFTPVTKFRASFNIKVEGNKARININGDSSPNWVFWIFFLVGLFTGIFLLIGVILFLIQQNKPKETCRGIIDAIDTEFGSI